jgi:hypothetical protein
MLRWISALLAGLLLAAPPALARSCKTAGSVDVSLVFPQNKASDVPFARAMAPITLPLFSDKVPVSVSCTRATVHTALGDYVIGGENRDAFPRVAVPADRSGGPVVYVGASPGLRGAYALVVLRRGASAMVTRFYSGIPTDARLAADVAAALADHEGILSYDVARNMVLYAFTPVGGIPPPVRPGGMTVAVGPQILVAGAGDPATLDVDGGFRHRPSGFACPQVLPGLAVTLNSVDPRRNSLVCSYRAGTDVAFRPDDPIRYQLSLEKTAPADSARKVFDQLSANGRASLRIKGNHPAPLAAGARPAPEFVAFWDTEDAGVQGLWVGTAGAWLVWLRAQYPSSKANDAEAGKAAQILFAAVAKEVK